MGSINLSSFIKKPFTKEAEFDFHEFKNTIRIAVRELNTVLDEGLLLHPLKEQQNSVRDWRQIGLGVMGIADMLIMIGARYGSKESIDLCNSIAFTMIDNCIYESSILAKEFGVFPKCNVGEIVSTKFFLENTTAETKSIVEKYGLRNSQLLTIAPTGSLSTMLGISGGIEPIFANFYERKTESLHGKDVFYKVYTPIVKKYMDMNDIKDDKDLPDFFITAQTLSYKERINMQSIWQKHIDASISSTVNVPNDFTVDDTFNLYLYAWEKGLKGVTIYRDGCKRSGILTTNKEEEEVETKLERGDIIQVNDDVIGKKRKLVTGCGSLHCQAFFDPVTGDLLETYFSKGSSGGCNNFMIGLSRMISLSARAGVDIYTIVDQLGSCGTCSSYAIRSATKRDTSVGACCPMAIGNALLGMWKEMQNEVGDSEDEPEEKPVMKTESKSYEKCPECGAKLIFSGGCTQCDSCGFSKCN